MRFFIGVLFLSTIAVADPVLLYQGAFQITPKGPHKTDPISGNMKLYYKKQTIDSVVLDLDKPVFNRSTYSSGEQWENKVTDNNVSQDIVVFKLIKPLHNWHFVFVGGTNDGGQTLNGTMFAAKEKFDDIKAKAQSLILQTPENWDTVGDATLKQGDKHE